MFLRHFNTFIRTIIEQRLWSQKTVTYQRLWSHKYTITILMSQWSHFMSLWIKLKKKKVTNTGPHKVTITQYKATNYDPHNTGQNG